MKPIDSLQLLQQLQKNVESLLFRAINLREIDAEYLKKSRHPESWSVLQIIEHLNSYNKYYLPQIELELERAATRGIPSSSRYTPGWFGNYFTRMMAPRDEKNKKKYKAPKDHTPPKSLDAVKVINDFIKGQNQLLRLLARAKTSDLGKIKVSISISKLIKLKLGDTFRFVIAHQLRHFQQLEVTLSEVAGIPVESPLKR